MKKIIITGGAGYIGAHIAVALAEQGYDPIILDDFRNSQRSVIDGIASLIGRKPTLLDIDCCDKATLLAAFTNLGYIDGVIHLAAFKAVGESVLDPLKYYRNNIGALDSVLSAMDTLGIEKLVFSSSCTVYGEPDTREVTESNPADRAMSPYGFTKQIGERLLVDYLNSGKPGRFISLRYFNPIGAHPSAAIGELPLGVPNNLVPYITQVAIGQRPELTVFGTDYDTPDGTCIRDYIHVVDLANAHVAALAKLGTGSCGVSPGFINIGCGKGASVKEIIETFQRVNKLELKVNYGERRPGDVPAIFANAALAKKELGWEAQYTTDQALEHAWNWQKKLETHEA